MKVVLFTGDENNGGIQQFTYTIVREIAKLGHQVNLFLPDLQKIIVSEDLFGKVIRYYKVDSVFPNTDKINRIVRDIEALNPDIVICPDDSIISCQVIGILNPRIKKCITIHDVTPHPSKFSLRRKIVSILWNWYRVYGLKKSDTVMLLSENGYNRFKEYYSKYAYKSIVCPLGAHPPVGIEECPNELYALRSSNFGLFFGRIDKYKGISRLLSAYQAAYDEDNTISPLVIAGNGALTEQDIQIISNNNNIYLINRFVENSEMLWLLTNCSFVVLPYIEASQSGVIPLAYYYGKPVIASKIPGLTEFVKNEETGFLFENNEELSNIFLNSQIDWAFMKDTCVAYYRNTLDWSGNISKLINAIIGNGIR